VFCAVWFSEFLQQTAQRRTQIEKEKQFTQFLKCTIDFCTRLYTIDFCTCVFSDFNGHTNTFFVSCAI